MIDGVKSDAFVGDLLRVLPGSEVVTDPDILRAFSDDRTAILSGGLPRVLVRPESTAHVVEVVRAAIRHRVPIVTRGGGTGLAGGATAIEGCVLLSTERMNRVEELNPLDLTVRVQPGAITFEVDRRAAEHGLRYPPDPASAAWSTIGGNIATNAGGLCCIAYGVTGDYVLSLEAVLGTGEVMRCGSPTRKGVAGYDLKRLLIGSEGTLAVITEAVLRLVPRRIDTAMVVGWFGSYEAAVRAIGQIGTSGASPTMLEFVDRASLDALERISPTGFDQGVRGLLFAATDRGEAAADVIGRCFAESGGEFVVSSDPIEMAQLIDLRRRVFPALEMMGSTLLEDVVVPPSRLGALIEGIETLAVHHGLTVATFGHAGEGNLHPTIVFDERDPDDRARVHHLFDEVLDLVGHLGGSITGEHGVGILKKSALGQEIGLVATRISRAIKDQFDPHGILNPGKGIA